MTQHTPGPWEARGERGLWKVYPLPCYPCQQPVASVHARDLGERFEEESSANAALISAAPELLEALNHAVVLLKFAFDDPSLLESQLAHETGALMTDALKKANGLEDEA